MPASTLSSDLSSDLSSGLGWVLASVLTTAPLLYPARVVITDDYASKFGPAMMGLSGSYEQVARAAENFQVTYVVSKSADSYTVQHSSSIYLLNPQGDLVDVFPFNAPPATLAQAIE